MSNLSNQYISSSYQSVLNVGTGSGDFISSTLKPLTDGYGTQVPVKLSTLGVELSGSISLTGSLVSSLIPAISNSIDLGSPTKPFRHLYVGSGSVYLNDNKILSLDTPGTDTTIASPPSGTVQLVNDIIFSSQEGLGYEGAPGFTIVGGGTNNQSQTKYSGDTISYHSGSHFLTNYWVDNNNVQTGDSSLQLELFKDNLKLATIENSRHFPTYYDSQYEINSIYEGSGSYNGAVRIKHTDIVNNEYSDISVGDDYVQMSAGNLSGSSVVPKAALIVLEDEISGYFTNSPSSASFTLSGNTFEVTGSIVATDGISGDLSGTASYALNANTASYALNALTASQALNSANADVATLALDSDLLQGTGSGVFATTGSNTFNGSQTISGSLNVTGSITALSASITYLETIYQTSSVIYTSGSNVLGDEAADVQTLNGRVDIPLGNLNVTGATTSSLGFFGNLQGTASYAVSSSQADNAVSSSHSLFAVSSSQADNAVSASQALNADNAVSASQAQNAVSASQSVNSDNAVSASQAQNAVSASQAQNSVSASNATFAEDAGKLDGKDSSEFAITGSNNFLGNQTITGSLNISDSSSVSRDVKLFSSASYGNSNVQPGAYITSSLPVSQSNLIFATIGGTEGQTPMAPNLSGSIILSGSNNILFTSNRLQTIGNGTIGTLNNLNYVQTIPTINTGSSYRPTISQNFLIGQATLTLGSGSGLFSLNNNYLGGTFNLNAPSASLGGTYSTNNILGTLTIQQTVPVTGSIAHTFQQNLLNGVLGLQVNSGSFQMNTNAINGNNIVVTGSYRSTGAAGTNGITFNNNTINGLAHRFLFDGAANGSKGFSNNLVVGANNTGSMVTNDTNGISNTALIGQGLHVEAGTNSGTGGSLIVGRYNETGSLANPGQYKLIVGNGTSNTNRVTSLALDANTNTFLYKSNINLTGSLDVSGSVTIANAGDLTMYGHKMFNTGQYISTETQSGSAATSQSINYNVSGPEFGVSLVSGSRITVANAGTYDIQFSTQMLADTGADDVIVWFKKNGSNISNSASKKALSNNEEMVVTVNLIDTANANDYYEIAWENVNGDAVLLAETGSGNYPGIPSAITTIKQVR